MAVAERIHQYVQRLPDRLQAEVLDFVEYLLAKAERESASQDDQEWNDLSLEFAMREREDEEGPEYSTADLREPFS
jgi:hypothetical protein